MLQIYHKSCYGLSEIMPASIDAVVTDPPYGIGYQSNEWDKTLPEKRIWTECIHVLKPGAYSLVFSSIRLMHRMMVDLEDAGFIIRDVLMWVYLNGMPKTRDVGLDIDKELNVESEIIGTYNYVQGYRKDGAETYTLNEKKYRMRPASDLGKRYEGSGTALKPAYEPIILIQKPTEDGLTVAQNVMKYGVGVLNLEATRVPYQEGEGKVGHNPHPVGRVSANVLRTEEHHDSYDKFFVVPKVRQHAEEFNNHPTLKPITLMHHLIKLVSFEGQTVLDPFMGSGSTGLAALELKRQFIGYELSQAYYAIAEKRFAMQAERLKQKELF